MTKFDTQVPCRTRRGRRSAFRCHIAPLVCISLALSFLAFSASPPHVGAAVSSTPSKQLGPVGASWSGVSCVSRSTCTVVGFANGAAAAISEQSGRWGRVHVIAGTAGGMLTSVTCFDALNCTAVGAIGFGPSAPQSVAPMVVEERQGLWGRPIKISGTSAENFGTAFTSVSCWSRSECFAVLTGPLGGMTAHEHNGTWGAAERLGPAGGSLNDVSCSPPGICYVVGATRSGSGYTARFGPNWSSFHNGQQSLNSISCTSGSDCVAVGGVGKKDPTFLIEASGFWSDSIRMKRSRGISFTKVSCGGNSSRCVAIGTGPNHSYAVTLRLSGATTPKNLGEPGLRSLSCPTADFCVAVGRHNTKGFVRAFKP